MPKPAICQETINSILERYKAGKSFAQIGVELGINPSTARKYILNLGIPRRTRGEQQTISRRHSGVNHSFFKQEMSDAHAYLVGLLATDGNIFIPKSQPNTRVITISSTDYELCALWNKFIGGTIKPYSSQGAYKAITVSRELADDLNSFGIYPRKTFTVEPSRALLASCHSSAYLRGVIDGDGWVHYQLHPSKFGTRIKLCIGFCTASRAFAEAFAERFPLFALYETTTALGKQFYKVEIKNLKGASELLELLYPEGRRPALSLQRKYELGSELLTWIQKCRQETRALRERVDAHGLKKVAADLATSEGTLAAVLSKRENAYG